METWLRDNTLASKTRGPEFRSIEHAYMQNGYGYGSPPVMPTSESGSKEPPEKLDSHIGELQL